jgi:chaperonin cofactor prefoldin
MCVKMVEQEDIQAIVQELQMVRSQIQSILTQNNEISLTIEALSTQPADKSVYRALGGILLEVEDRESLAADLESSSATLSGHLERLNEREVEIRAEYARMAESIE